MPQPKGRDLRETQGQLLDWLALKLPDASKLRVEELRGPSDTGFSSDTLMFRLAHESDGRSQERELVLRLKPVSDFGVFPEYDVALQYRMMRALAESDVPVPSMLWLEEDPAPLGSPFYIMEKLEGRVPNDNPPYHREGWVCELGPEERERLWMSGLDAMARVHALDAEAPAFDFLPRPPAGKTALEAQLEYWEQYFDWGLERSRYPVLEAGLAWLKQARPRDEAVGICWGDSRISNQIFRDGEVAAVIDWEMVFRGNPVADLAWFVTIDRINSEGIGTPRLEGMPGREATVARWEERLGRKAEHFEYYEVFCALRYAAILARVFLQMKHYELMPAQATVDADNFASQDLAALLERVGAPSGA